MIDTIDNLIPKMLKLDRTKKYELKEYKQKRSLDANAYYWSLVGQIADKNNLNKEELHFKYLKEYGQGYTIPLPKTQEIKGYVKYYEAHGSGKLNDIEVNYYRVFKPSSEMNSKEFWILIKGVEQDAIALDIEILEERKSRELVEQLDKENER